jgi:DNA primase catalytic core
MRFPPAFLDDIRARIPISQVVGRAVAWDKRKSNPGRGDFWACCPFHGEKTPSFHADDRKGRYHCFGCGASGDHFKFLVDAQGLSFPEAVAELAAEAGIPLPERDPDAERREAVRSSLYEVMEKAARFFEAALQGSDGAKARAYLRDRGLAPEVQKRFRIGYAPASRNALKDHLAGAGIAPEQMVEAGLVIAGDDIPVSYDRFRDRVMFPIADSRGRIIAFGGRALAAEVQPKYLNSPETPLFHKSSVLYNGHAARAAVRKGGPVIAVEGYIDVIASVEAFEATVAPLGTALTEDQMGALWQMTDEPILCFDGDEAGLKAAYRAIDVAMPHLRPGKSLKFALLPEGQDPDSLIRTEGLNRFKEAIASAKPLVEMLWLRETQGVDLSTPERQAALEANLYRVIGRIGDGDVMRRYRAHVRLRLAQLFDLSRPKRSPLNEALIPPRLSSGSIERMILGFCVEFPFLLADFVEEICSIPFSSEVYTKFSKALHMLYLECPDIDVHVIYKRLSPEFYFVLNSIHGDERIKIAKAPDGRVVAQFVEARGAKLRRMFPMLRYNPPEDLLRATVTFLLLKLELVQKEQMKATDVMGLKGEAADFDRRIDAAVAQLSQLRRLVHEQEAELEYRYQRLKADFSKAA